MRPKSLRLNVLAGWAIPLTEDAGARTGYNMGLESAIGFSDRLRLWVEGSALKLGYEAYEIAPAKGIPVSGTTF